MPQFRLTLMQNMPNRDVAALEVKYSYYDGSEHSWFVTPVGPYRDQAVVIVDAPVNLLQPNVKSRLLRAHYPTLPTETDIVISSVQPALAEKASQTTKEKIMATEYKVTISMDQDTVNQLTVGDFILYGFKAVKGPGGGAPLTWFQTTTFATSTTLTWSEQYQAYDSLQDLQSGVQIDASNTYDIDLGEKLLITSSSGTGSVSRDGAPGAVVIATDTSVERQFTVGISQPNSATNTPTPLCAFPLLGAGGADEIEPIEKVLLMFATQTINTGTVIEKSFSAGIVIDLTGAPGNSREVAFSTTDGWNENTEGWALVIPAQYNLVPLMTQGVSLRRVAAELQRA